MRRHTVFLAAVVLCCWLVQSSVAEDQHVLAHEGTTTYLTQSSFMELAMSARGTQSCGNTKATCCNRLICPYVNGVCCSSGYCCPTGTVCLPRMPGQQQVCGIPAPCQCPPRCTDPICPQVPQCCDAYRQQQQQQSSCSCPSSCQTSDCPNRPPCCPSLQLQQQQPYVPPCNCPPPCLPPGPCPERPSCCPSITAPPRNGCFYPSPCTQPTCRPILADCNQYGYGQYTVNVPVQGVSNDIAAASLSV